MIEIRSISYNEYLENEEPWTKSIKYGTICLEELKCPSSNQMKAFKKMVTQDSEENYKSNHVVHSNVWTALEEDGALDEEAPCAEDVFTLIWNLWKKMEPLIKKKQVMNMDLFWFEILIECKKNGKIWIELYVANQYMRRKNKYEGWGGTTDGEPF